MTCLVIVFTFKKISAKRDVFAHLLIKFIKISAKRDVFEPLNF